MFHRSSHRLTKALIVMAGMVAGGAAEAQDVELYDQPKFAGIRLALSANVADVAAYGLGGRIASVIVNKGQWEFCTQPQFGGACITVGPGRYAEMPPALRGTLASLRMAGTTTAVPVTPAAPVAPVAPAVPDAIALYEHQQSGGRRLGLAAAAANLGLLDFNDLASSVEVMRGRWQLCVHADFGGECQVFGPGRHALVGRFHDSVSSVRPVYGRDDKPLGTTGGLVLFEHSDFKGRELMIGAATPNLSTLDFNDRTSSIEVLAGRWELCTDSEYRGRCVELAPGRHNLERSLNDRISSARPK
jgi:hypothetical protein